MVSIHSGIENWLPTCRRQEVLPGSGAWLHRGAKLGARAIFELAAPNLYGDRETRDWKAGYEWWEELCKERLSNYSLKYNLWIPVAMQAGRTSDDDFPGGGYLFSPQGERVYATKDWQPGVAYLEIDFESGQVREL